MAAGGISLLPRKKSPSISVGAHFGLRFCHFCSCAYCGLATLRTGTIFSSNDATNCLPVLYVQTQAVPPGWHAKCNAGTREHNSRYSGVGRSGVHDV